MKEFIRTVLSISQKAVLQNIYNFTWSHYTYKLKVNEDNCPQLKAQISPNGNEDRIMNGLKYYCKICSTGACGLFSK